MFQKCVDVALRHLINVVISIDFDKNLSKINLRNSMALRNAKILDAGSSAVQAGNARQLWHETGPCSFEHKLFPIPVCSFSSLAAVSP